MAFDIKVATICHSINTREFNSAYALISNTKEAAASSLWKKKDIEKLKKQKSFILSYRPAPFNLTLNFQQNTQSSVIDFSLWLEARHGRPFSVVPEMFSQGLKVW